VTQALSENDRAVLAALGGAGRPLSAYGILERARSSAIRAPTQVYRSLQKLEGRGLVHRIAALSAFVACSDRHDERHRPGFLICRACGCVREFEDPRIPELAREAAGDRFCVDAVSLEIFGRCKACEEGA
jgi:Fur family zinc uptake transcriptional regulator